MPRPSLVLSALWLTSLPALSAAELASASVEWVVLQPARAVSSDGAAHTVDAEGWIAVASAGAGPSAHTIDVFPAVTGITGLRLELVPPAPAGALALTGVAVSEAGLLGLAPPTSVVLTSAWAAEAAPDRPITLALDGNAHTSFAPVEGARVPVIALFQPREPIAGGLATRLSFRLDFARAGAPARLRLSATSASDPLEGRGVASPIEWHKEQERINRAIDRGVEFLLGQQELDGSWRYHQDAYPPGQTALALYTLLKSGTPRDHPAVRRAVEFLRCHPPRKTYSLGCVVLALCALKDERERPWIASLVDELVSWQQEGFAYDGERGGEVDLSNTQYGALALYTASENGFDVPDKAWRRLAARALKQQEKVEGGYDPAGFGYRSAAGPSGSMTAAGVGILAMCEARLERGKNDVVVGRKRGVEWLARNFSVTSNPVPDGTPNNRWLHYYLYGLERVGGITGLERFGTHDWYREGAVVLVDSQAPVGSWTSPDGDPQPDSCFALLFLARATSPTSGSSLALSAKSFGEDDPHADVSLRTAGDSPMSLWISSFGDDARAELEWPGEERRGPRVARVEYELLRDGAATPLVLTVQGDASKPAGLERFALRHTFERSGAYRIRARVWVATPLEGSELRALESAELALRVFAGRDAELVRYAGDAARNLLAGAEVRVVASSELGPAHAAALAADGLQARGWLSADSDRSPTLTLELGRPVRADRLLLSHARSGDDERGARIARVEVVLNGSRNTTFEIEMDPDDDQKALLALDSPLVVRRIELRVLDTAPGSVKKKRAVGFGEVELQLGRS